MVTQRTAQLKKFIYWPLAIPSLIAYFFVTKENKQKLIKDIDRFWMHYRGHQSKTLWERFYAFYFLMCGIREFRNVFYMRLGYSSLLIQFFLPPMVELTFATRSRFIGGGVFIQHGYTAVIDAESIGENLWVNQNVTIGHVGKGHPTIGNNVRIGTGAFVGGRIKIGNNVNIGANAIVIKDVPDNCTVVSPAAFIVKRDGIKVHESL